MLHLSRLVIQRFAGVALSLSLCPVLSALPTAKVSPVRPLQTQLIAPLDISRIRLGSTVLVRVDLEWESSNCTLEAGSILQGHVVEVVKRSKGVKDSQVQIVFKGADCKDHPDPGFRLSLIALVGPGGASSGQSGFAEGPPLADAVGLSMGGGMRSALAASEITSYSPLPVRNLPDQIVSGQVVAIRKMNLKVAKGVDGASILTALGHDFRLEKGTSLILMHSVTGNAVTGNAVAGGSASSVASNVPAASNPAKSAGTSRAAPSIILPEAPDETEICSGLCNVVNGTEPESEIHDRPAVASLTLEKYGYFPRTSLELGSFDNEITLTYLDAHNLLCTFDPHSLRERASMGEEATRKVRAVLIDPQTQSVKRVMDWRVRGDDQYLWKLSEGRVLVHMGHELKVLDGQLTPLRTIHVDGKVAWVVSSPTSDHIAVGTIRERHSESVHRDLEDVSADAPEEDVDVRVFDKNLAVVFSAHATSKTPIPVLSDTGELRVHGDGHTHWKITEFRWDRTEHSVASTRSACRPVLSTPAADLIFAVGCTTTGGRWYRMLRPDGHSLLKGESPSDEIQHSAQAVGRAFAVRIVKTARAMNYGQPFNKADLRQQRISIYRSDGATLATVNTADFALSQTAFALSPSGDQMSLIGGNSIHFYDIQGRRDR